MRHWPIRLHDAIQAVLFDRPDGQAATSDIAAQVNQRRLYVQKSGGPVSADQIFLRAKNYPGLFRLVDRNTVSLILLPSAPTPDKPKTRTITAGTNHPALKQSTKSIRAGAQPNFDRRVKRLEAKKRLRQQREHEMERQLAEEKALKPGTWRPSSSGPTLPTEI